MSLTTQFTNENIYGRDFKVSNDERLLARTYKGNWFLIKRSGQRTWEAICVAQRGDSTYNNNAIHTLTGNSRDIIKKCHEVLQIKDLYSVHDQGEYRRAMMSIACSGEINSIITVEVA